MNEINYITESRTHDIMVEYRCGCWSKGAVESSGWSLDTVEVKAEQFLKKNKKTKARIFYSQLCLSLFKIYADV